jgi:hypothetical protein
VLLFLRFKVAFFNLVFLFFVRMFRRTLGNFTLAFFALLRLSLF